MAPKYHRLGRKYSPSWSEIFTFWPEIFTFWPEIFQGDAQISSNSGKIFTSQAQKCAGRRQKSSRGAQKLCFGLSKCTPTPQLDKSRCGRPGRLCAGACRCSRSRSTSPRARRPLRTARRLGLSTERGPAPPRPRGRAGSP